jgi:hypothetical protein
MKAAARPASGVDRGSSLWRPLPQRCSPWQCIYWLQQIDPRSPWVAALQSRLAAAGIR